MQIRKITCKLANPFITLRQIFIGLRLDRWDFKGLHWFAYKLLSLLMAILYILRSNIFFFQKAKSFTFFVDIWIIRQLLITADFNIKSTQEHVGEMVNLIFRQEVSKCW